MAKKKAKWSDLLIGGLIVVLIAAALELPGGLIFTMIVGGALVVYSRWKADSVQGAPEPQLSQRTTATVQVQVTVPAGKSTGMAVSVDPIASPVAHRAATNLEGISSNREVPTAPHNFASATVSQAANQTTPTAPVAVPRAFQFAEVDVPVVAPVRPSPVVDTAKFRIPSPPPHYGDAKWVPEGEDVTVAGLKVPGGLFYVGTKLIVSNRRQNDPCLIDPSLPVAEEGNYFLRQMDYWPSYSSITPQARRSYLNWLVAGRKDSDADIGFVFLFFYGLERRVLVDSAKDESLRNEWPFIKQELLRLIAVYGSKSHSFHSYATSLLTWLSLASVRDKTYLKTVPHYDRKWELPFPIRLALGQAAVDKAPVPCALALAWLKLHPMTNLRTPALRCKDEFDELFATAYARTFGDGMVIAKNRTKLKLVHQPASSAFNGELQSVAIGDVPDVAVLTAPIKKLQDLAQDVTDDLDSFSRFLARNPEKRAALEGTLLLPASLWPHQVRRALEQMREKVSKGPVLIKFSELTTTLGAHGLLSKDQSLALARALESSDIAIEPDILAGARAVKLDENVVLFHSPRTESTSRSTSAYKAALLTLQLASTVANADGEFSDGEYEHLQAQVHSWTHLARDHIRRLSAHLQLLRAAPASLTSLRSKLDTFDARGKEAVASFLASVAQADGHVSPEEVKFLEKLYKTLGVDTQKVFSHVHAASSGNPMTMVQPAASSPAASGFKLDTERIAALQKETAAVTAMLAEIFQEEELPVPVAPVTEEAAISVTTQGILGLDEVHSAMARMLLSRAAWTRDELNDIAADLDLMLDGALETINEAAFDAHDMPLTEGDDSITVNPELLEKLAA